MQQFSKAKTIKIFLFAFLLFAAGTANAQVGIGTTKPDTSAQLDVSSINKGFLPPRMTQAQKDAIINPAPGLMIWCTDCGLSGEILVHNGTTWTKAIGRTGRNYYVKEKKYGGGDGYDGLTSDHAWQTIDKVNAEMKLGHISPGDSILFERGSYFYGTIHITRAGNAGNPIVFGAYGTGHKPVFIGATQINDPEILLKHPWKLKEGTDHVYEKEDGTFDVDVANLVFNNKDSFGTKIMADTILYDTIRDISGKDSIVNFTPLFARYISGTKILDPFTPILTNPGQFWYDFSKKVIQLYCLNNPSTTYSSIQSVKNINAIDFPETSISSFYIVFENLDFRYYGKCVWESRGNNCSFRNLDISYIGGGDHFGNPDTIRGGPGAYKERYGNGLQIWNDDSNLSSHDITITGCVIDNVYDAGITPQGGTQKKPYSVYNLYIRNNVISNCEWSFEFWERAHPFDSPRTRNNNISIHDIYIENNTCINAGGGWGHKQRPNKWSTHFRMEGFDGTLSNIFIRNNIFYGAAERLYWIIFPRDVPNIVSDYNDFYQDATHSGKPFGTISADDKDPTGGKINSYSLSDWRDSIYKYGNSIKEVSSISDNPLFINYPKDLHLQPGSPVIGKGIDVGYGKDMGAYPYVTGGK